jgi:hypothetical protein
LLQALQLLPASRKGCAIFITSQTLNKAAVVKELDASGDNGATSLFAHELTHFTPHECVQLFVRACPLHTHGGLHNHLHELKLIVGDGPDPLHHLAYLPLAVRTFVEWASEQYLRNMRLHTPERVEEMVARWLRVCDTNSPLLLCRLIPAAGGARQGRACRPTLRSRRHGCETQGGH